MAEPALNPEYLLLEKHLYTEEEFFEWEDRSPERWEFLPNGPRDALGQRRGLIRAMSGGTADHGGIAANLIIALGNTLRNPGGQPCRPFGSDLKVHCPDGRNTYPDVTVACGPVQFYGGRRDIILNPLLLAEVLSLSTAGDDRGNKWNSYRNIPTLQHYLLIAADQIRVEMYTRDETGWRLETWEGPEAHLPLPALGTTLLLADLYILVDFQPDSS